jgi:type VI secretion system protein ImpA
MVNLDKYLQPVSPDRPGGEDLERDPGFAVLRGLIAGPGEGLVEQEDRGDTTNWAEVIEQCEKLLARSKNLEVGLILTLALLQKHGLEGFADGVAFLRKLSEGFWAVLYPAPDAEYAEGQADRYLERLNLLRNLSPEVVSDGDPYRFVQRLRKLPLLDGGQLGRFSLGDYRASLNPGAATGGKSASPALLQSALEATKPAALEQARQACARLLEDLSGLQGYLAKVCGEGHGATFRALREALEQMKRFLSGSGVGEEGAAVAAVASGGQNAGSTRSSGQLGGVNSRPEVIQALDLIIRYYERCEPNSPIPFMLKRAKRMVNMNFIELIQDLNEPALEQIMVVTGRVPLPEPKQPAS